MSDLKAMVPGFGSWFFASGELNNMKKVLQKRLLST